MSQQIDPCTICTLTRPELLLRFCVRESQDAITVELRQVSDTFFPDAGSQMTVFGPSLDLRSRETFNSIAYDPLTTTLWLCMGSTLALYDLSDPNNPAPGPKLSPKGFFPFVSGVAFDVPERKAFYISQDANRSGGKLQVRVDF